jgi:hypothetical protein
MSRIYRANRKPKGNITGPLSPTGSKFGDLVHGAQVRVGTMPKPTPPQPAPPIQRTEEKDGLLSDRIADALRKGREARDKSYRTTTSKTRQF